MNPLRGILFKVGSVVVFVIMASLIKATASEVPPGEQVFFRSFFAIPVILLWLIRRGKLTTGLWTARPLGHVYRGFVGTAAMGCGFAALGLLTLPEATALGYAAPLLTVIFAAMFLGEQVGLVRLSSVALGLVGVLIVLSPQLGGVGADTTPARTLGAVFALLGALMAALAQIFVRKLVADESTSAIVFWFSVTATVLALTTIPFGWVMPAPKIFALLVIAGLLGGIGQILLTEGYRHADASLVAPFDYASMIFALLIGYLVFQEIPSGRTLIGAGVVILAGVLIIWREHRLGLERGRQRKAMTPQG